ncbi:hypothetical protein [Luteitalea sp.]|uniref:hypothetical protein n=1 Tax=Luteitalea sp. TaxID=2004800 RepID=UPI0025C5F6B2|nr:hypothetical protein [Luteitalea sp.]
MTHDVQQERAISAADVLDRIGAGLIELNGRLQAADEETLGRHELLEALDAFVEATLPDLTDLSMQIRPARIVRPGES